MICRAAASCTSTKENRLLDLDRTDHARRHACFIGNGADQIAWPDAGGSPGAHIHPHGTGCPATTTRPPSRRTPTIPLLARRSVGRTQKER